MTLLHVIMILILIVKITSGDNSCSASLDENSDTEPKTELSIQTSKDGLIWRDRASGRGQRPACNVIHIAPGLARPVDTIVDAFQLFKSADVRVLTFVNFVYMRGGMCVRDEAV